jgi:hypothetical protein
MPEGSSFKIDIGLAETVNAVADIIGFRHGSWLPRAQARIQAADLQQVQRNLVILRKVGAFLQKLVFDNHGGLRDRLSKFRQSPTYRNASQLRAALANTARIMTQEYFAFLETWDSPETAEYVRNEYPRLSEAVTSVAQLKGDLFEDQLAPQNYWERIPFFRSRRYRRLAQSYEEIERRFAACNTELRDVRDALSQVIDAYEQKQRELLAVNARTSEGNSRKS